jgi:hypothetical protein
MNATIQSSKLKGGNNELVEVLSGHSFSVRCSRSIGRQRPLSDSRTIGSAGDLSGHSFMEPLGRSGRHPDFAICAQADVYLLVAMEKKSHCVLLYPRDRPILAGQLHVGRHGELSTELFCP